jgi:putative phage-type endonuclease
MMIVDVRPLSDEWFAYRQPRATGSTVGAILGESKYSSALNEWARIVGRVTPERTSNPYADWGLGTEGVHRAWFAADHGCKAEDAPYIVQHPEIDWLCCSPDGFVSEAEPPHKCLLQLKAPSPWTADEWQQKLPLAYQIQLQIEMLCCGLGESFLSVILPPKKDTMGSLMGLAMDLDQGKNLLAALQDRGFTRQDYFLEADAEFQRAAVSKLKRWWAEYVETGIAPDATGAACDKEVLKGLGGECDLDFDEDAVAMVEELDDIQQRIKNLKAEEETRKNKLTQKANVPTWREAKKAINAARRAVG